MELEITRRQNIRVTSIFGEATKPNLTVTSFDEKISGHSGGPAHIRRLELRATVRDRDTTFDVKWIWSIPHDEAILLRKKLSELKETIEGTSTVQNEETEARLTDFLTFRSSPQIKGEDWPAELIFNEKGLSVSVPISDVSPINALSLALQG